MSQPTRRQILRYRFDSFMARGGSSIFLCLFVMFSALLTGIVILRGLIIAIWGETFSSQHKGFWKQVYITFLELTDPGNMAQDIESSTIYKVSAVIAGMAGVIILSMLIAFITTALDQKLNQLKKGHSKVIEEGHTLILGWNDRVVEVLRELIIANESEDNPCVVILSEKDKEFMDDYLNVTMPNTQNTRVVTRSGSVSALVNLDIASVQTCKSIIILGYCSDAAPAAAKAASDTRVIKTVLGVIASKADDQEMNIVVELFNERSRRIAHEISPDEVTTVNGLEVLAKILVQTSRSVGLSVVYNEILSFDGCEMYFYNAEWGDMTFGQLQFHFPDGVPMGVRTAEREITVNPPITYKMKPDDDVLIVAEDDSTIEFVKEPVAAPHPMTLAGGRLEQQTEAQMIIGWNAKAPIVLHEYGDYVLEGSKIKIVMPNPDQEIRDEIASLIEDLPHLDVELVELDPMKSESLLEAEPFNYNNIIILSQGGENADPETTDSETIVILLLLRKIFEASDKDTEFTKLISEVMDSRNQELVSRAGVNDFIISNRLVSMLLAQISENADIRHVYDDLFQADGSEIYLKPASLYFKEFPAEVTFADMMGLAQQREEICMGVKIKSEERNIHNNFGVKLIPEKNTVFKLNPDDSLVVISEDET